MNEFDLIKKYFAALAAHQGFSLVDDAACIFAPAGYELVITKDLIVEGVHFFGDETPKNIAQKLLRVNLSDLAAKGAKPEFYLLGCGFPRNVNEKWIKDFAAGLAVDQKKYGIKLLGGDTTKTTGKAVFSLTAIGYVKKGKMLKRSGAQAGDDIYVSGNIGDAKIGLEARRGKVKTSNEKYFLQRYLLPEPRLELGQKIAELASAAIDISDGLAAELSHICAASKSGAEVFLEKIPFSKGSKIIAAKELITAGDDYEILFSASKKYRKKIANLAKNLKLKITLVGQIKPLSYGVKILDENKKPIKFTKTGYRHF